MSRGAAISFPEWPGSGQRVRFGASMSYEHGGECVRTLAHGRAGWARPRRFLSSASGALCRCDRGGIRRVGQSHEERSSRRRGSSRERDPEATARKVESVGRETPRRVPVLRRGPEPVAAGRGPGRAAAGRLLRLPPLDPDRRAGGIRDAARAAGPSSAGRRPRRLGRHRGGAAAGGASRPSASSWERNRSRNPRRSPALTSAIVPSRRMTTENGSARTA